VGLLVLGCTGPPAEVVISTRVGDEQARADVAGAREAGSLLVDDARSWWARHPLRRALGPSPAPAADGEELRSADDEPIAARVDVIRYEPAPARELEQLHAQLHALREGPTDEIAMLARNIAQADPTTWPAIRAALLGERERPKREYKQVLAVIGGDVPNRYGHFALHWKKAHGHDVRVSDDWFEDLLALEPARISKPLRPVYRDTVLTVALLQAATHVAQTEPRLVSEVVTTLLDAAYVHDGTFRDEVGRSVSAIGNPAIPHLMRESVASETWAEGSVEERRAAYATYCLDRMDRLHPSRALDAVADDRRLLADVLASYAEVRDGEAAPLLLDWVDADAPGVRRAARASFEAYVTGPLPKVRRKSIRLLGGKTSTQRAELSHREHARLAIRDRLGATAPELLEPECALWLSGGLIDPECERQPERLFRAYLDHLDQRRLVRRDAIVAEALASADLDHGAALLDTLLTDGSDPVDPDLIAPFYVEVATRAEAAGDPTRAAQLLRKSAMLLADHEPERARELTVDALVLESSVDGLDEPGKAMLLGTARELGEDDPVVAGALAALEHERGRSRASLREHLLWALLLLFAGLGLLAGIAARVHRPRAAYSSTGCVR
jgi:hypothetical protein